MILAGARRRRKRSTRLSGLSPVGVMSNLPGYYGYWKQTFDLDVSELVDEWTEESGNGLDLTPPSTSPSSRAYWFSGYRGVENRRELDLAVAKTISPPYHVWVAFECESLTAVQYIFSSADNATDWLMITTAGAIRWRVDGVNNVIAPNGSIVAGTRYVLGIFCDASGDLTIELNGTAIDNGASDTSSWDFHHTGRDTASSDSRLGALLICEAEITDSDKVFVKGEFDPFLKDTFAAFGLSNTWHAVQGYNEVGGVRMMHSLSGYPNNDLKSWFDAIGSTGVPPWKNLIDQLSKTASGGHQYVSDIWFYVGISNSNAGAPLATRQDWITDCLQEVRDQMDATGHDGTNATAYITSMAFYDPDVDCTIVSTGAYADALEIAEWGIANLTNVERGPALPTITSVNASDGDPNPSPCHVHPDYWKDDGWVLRNFFDDL